MKMNRMVIPALAVGLMFSAGTRRAAAQVISTGEYIGMASSFESELKRKTVGADEAAARVKSGDWIDYGFGVGQPDVFDRAALERLFAEHGSRIAGVVTEIPTNPLIQPPDVAALVRAGLLHLPISAILVHLTTQQKKHYEKSTIPVARTKSVW